MNILRLTLIAFSLVVLVNCGGGGGSGSTAAARMPTAMMPGTDSPNMPPTVVLHDYAITNLDMTRDIVRGTPPTATNTMTETPVLDEIKETTEPVLIDMLPIFLLGLTLL